MFQDLADTKPSIVSAIVILAIVITTVPVAKAVFNRFPVPGLTPLINAI